MNTTRRQFIKLASATGGALVLGIRLSAEEEDALPNEPFAPNAWVSIDPDGTVLVRIGKSEMGQGVRTSLPMVLAEELDADFETITIEQASPGPEFNRLGTGGSGSIMRLWDPLREAGATARAMLVSAAASRWDVPTAECSTRSSTVVHAPSGRTATYGELTAEAAKLPVPTEVPLKDKSEYSLIGTSRKRIDGIDIVTGRARYGIDVREPDMLFAVVARQPSFGATLGRIDQKNAAAREGVTHILTIPSGVAVVATNSWAALRGRDNLEIEWKPGADGDFDGQVHAKALREAARNAGITIRKDGEGALTLDRAHRRIESVYEYGFQAHAPVEPVNCTVRFDGESCTIWSPTQTPNSVHAMAAEVLDLDPSRVHVNVMLIGGGFGRRLGHDFDREAVEIARQLPGTTVQLLWSREDDMRHGYFQAASAHGMVAAVSEDGRIDTWIHRKVSSPHNARRPVSEANKRDPEFVRGHSWGVYDTPYFVPSMEMSYTVVDSPVPIGPWRSVFSPPSVFARECFLDEVAVELGRDPFDLRLELLGATNPEIPERLEIGGNTIDRPRLVNVLRSVRELARWGSRVPEGWSRGIACNVFHTETYIAYVVDVSLETDPRPGELPFRVERVACAIDLGVAVNPHGVEQQIESGIAWSLSNMKGEITFRDGRAEQAYYSDFPVAMIDDMPRSIDVVIVPSDDERPHGIGEPVVCPFAPAVANAVSRLTGERIRRLPV